MTHTIRFTKMHALLNDFMVINALEHKNDLQKSLVAKLANRHAGVGFDQMLIIEPSEKADYFCHIFNSDGSEAEQCGNGLRCIARYLHEEGIENKKQFSIETRAGISSVEIRDYDHIRISMGMPDITHPLIELKNDTPVNVSILSLGNPHAVTKVDDVETIDIEQTAKQIAANKFFPEGVNVGFMQIMNKNHVRLRTFERGAGETWACGSNACASAVAGILSHSLESPVRVEFSCGSLTVDWAGEGKQVYMEGRAERVFEGNIEVK